MKTYRGSGDTVNRVAPAGGAKAGVPLIYGQEVVIPLSDAEPGHVVTCLTRGIVRLPAAAGETFGPGQVAYWRQSAQVVVATPQPGDVAIGLADGPAYDGSVSVRLAGVSGGAGEGDITAVYAGSGLTGGGTSGDVTLAADTTILATWTALGSSQGASYVGIEDPGGYYEENTVQGALGQLAPLAEVGLTTVVISTGSSTGSAPVREGHNVVLGAYPVSGAESHIKSVAIAGGDVTVTLGANQTEGDCSVAVVTVRAPET